MNIIHPIHAILEFYMQISGGNHEIMRVREVLSFNMHEACMLWVDVVYSI